MVDQVRLTPPAKAALKEVQKMIALEYADAPPKAGRAVEIAIMIARGLLSGELERHYC